MNALATVTFMPIDPALAKRVRAVAQAAEKKRQERDELILAAHAAGASLREIGDLVGLSHVGVMKIVKKTHEGRDSLVIASIEGTVPLAAVAEAAEEAADREDRKR